MLNVPPEETFRCEVVAEREVARVLPHGELDLATTSVLKSTLDELFDAGLPHIVLDLQELTFIDSTGLRMVVRAKRTARERDVRLDLLPGPPDVHRLFEITGTDVLFTA
jgi:anti-sigma B factor antagonist